MRINFVKSARKPPGECGKCSREIAIGDPYKWIKFRYGGKRIRCGTCPSWRPSEMTTSGQLSQIYGAQERFSDEISGCESRDDIASLLEEVAGEIREAAEMYREAASNIEDGFGHSTYVSDELNEKADNVESWADDIESALDNASDDFDEDDVRRDAEVEILHDMLTELGEQTGSVVDTPEDLDGQELVAWVRAEVDGFDSEDFDSRVEETVEEARNESIDSLRDEVSGTVDECPL